MNELIGTGVALVTPFKSDISIDFDALSNIVEHQIANGTNYLVILGTTGETATLNKQEKQQVIDCIVQTNAKRLPLVLGVGGNNTQEVAEAISEVSVNDFCAVLSVSPYYNKPNQEGIYQHYKTVASHSKLPIIIYNVPGRTGSNMTAETQLRLAQIPNIVATKEASGNMEQVMFILANKPKDFLVISGDDALTYPLMALGAKGVISVINHAYPKTFSSMVQACLNGEWDKARELHYQTLTAAVAIFEDGSPSGIKTMLNEMGLCEPFVRAPLWPVNATVESKLRALTLK